MDEEPRAAVTGPGTTAAEAGPAAQEISEVFRGSAGESPALKRSGAAGAAKPASTVRGIQRAAVPAFVAGQELADLAEHDQRIVVLTADLAGAGGRADPVGT
jgi:transketolase